MPPRDQELPEGTDQIINGAMETGAGTGASTGSSGTGFGGTSSGGTTPGGSADFASGTGTGAAGGSSSGFIGAGASGSGDDTAGLTGGTGAGLAGGSDFGGTSTGGGSSGGFSGGSDLGGGGSGGSFGGSGSSEFGGSGSGGVAEQARGGAQSLKQQATDKVRTYAEDGKSRATSALDDFAQLVNETAGTIDERLGAQYGDYARRAADTVTDLSETLRNKQVDELFDDARTLVRKSPAVAIGAAAAVGFALVRLIKSGMPDEQNDGNFQPDRQLSSGTTAGSSTGSSTAGSSNVDSQAPYVAPTTGV